MCRESIFFKLASLVALVIFFGGTASGAIIVNGSSTNVALGNGVHINANDDPTVLKGNLFATPELIKNQANETKTGTIAFSEIPVLSLATGQFFQLIYDQQETKFNEQVHIDDIVISVGGTTIWDYDQGSNGSIQLNTNSADFTATTLGAGGDLELLIPVSLFDGMGFTGSDILTFVATQSNSDNGGDEWATLEGGDFFNPDDTIDSSTVVPEPSTFAIWAALVGFCLCACRRRTAKRSQI